jgi:hypothetical protein
LIKKSVAILTQAAFSNTLAMEEGEKCRFSSPDFINPATKYIVLSQRVSVRSKTSKRRFSHSKASFDNAVCGQTRVGLTY